MDLKKSKKIKYSEKKDSFIRKCPGSPGQACCDYYIISPAYGCPFDCSYCFMHAYFEDTSTITLFNNNEYLFNQLVDFLEKNKNKKIRIGSGEFTDSLAIPELDEFNSQVMDIFKSYPNACFEFKTKSDRIDLLLNKKAQKNIICAWSMNPQEIIITEEKGTASYKNRLNAAIKAYKHGYKTAFHFDPIFMNTENLSKYKQVAREIIDKVDNIVWFSMGGFRYTSNLKLAMLEKKLGNLDYFGEEFLLSKDGKYRYPKALRLKYYNELAKIINSKKKINLYTCMESFDLWEDSNWDTCRVLSKLHYNS